MNAGLQVYNSDGILQITDLFNNIQFVAKLTVTVNGPYAIGASWGNTLSRQSVDIGMDQLSNCLFALRCENDKFISWNQYFPVLQYPPWKFGPPRLAIHGEPGALVNIYVFTYSDIPEGEHFEVRNSAGEIVFSDKGRFMKVLDSRNDSRPFTFGTNQIGSILGTTNHASTVKTAVAIGNYCYNTDLDNNSRKGDAYRQSFKFNSTSTVSSYEAYVYHSDPHNYYYKYRTYDLNYQYLVLDVTNY